MDVKKDWAAQLRQAVSASGMTRYAIHIASGNDEGSRVRQSVLARFVAGGGITLETAERIAAIVGCDLLTPKTAALIGQMAGKTRKT
jgi:hypothetical protein